MAGEEAASAEPIPASRCPRCERWWAPPVGLCPDDGTATVATTLAGYGEVISFTTLHAPPRGFASPLHLALVQLDRGAKFFCHGAGTRGLRVGSQVTIEAVDHIYYFSTLGLRERAALFWRRQAAPATARLSAFARSAAKRLARGGRGSA